MIKKRRKEIYQPPYAQDLSGFSANGQEVKPMGECVAGPSPHYSCEVGSGFVGACSLGTTPDVSSCETGGDHAYPSCNPGSFASTKCWSGGGQNF